MTTTRINHTGHNHPNTTAARTACRKGNTALVLVPAGMVGKGKSIHRLVLAGSAPYANCGAGLGRPGDVSRSVKDLPMSSITCGRCHVRNS